MNKKKNKDIRRKINKKTATSTNEKQKCKKNFLLHSSKTYKTKAHTHTIKH